MLTALKFRDNSMKSLLAKRLYPCVYLNWIRKCFSSLITSVNCVLLDKTKTFIMVLRVSAWSQVPEGPLIPYFTSLWLTKPGWNKVSHGRNRNRTSSDRNTKPVSMESAKFLAFKHYIAYIQTQRFLHPHTMVLFRHSFYTLFDNGVNF